MKKIIYLFVLTTLLTLSACSFSAEKNEQDVATDDKTQSQEQVTVQIQESNDEYNANIENGLKELDLVDKE